MKKGKSYKKVIFIVLISIIAIATLGIITYKILNDEDKLTVEEKEWITQNINQVHSVYVPVNLDVFGKNGTGVFFDYVGYVEEKYGIDINPITYNVGEEVSDRAFMITYDLLDSDVLFYTEHYVVVSKEKQNISSLAQLSDSRLGVLAPDESLVSKYLVDTSNVVVNPYETSTDLLNALETNEDIDYAVLPLEENLTSILTSNYNIDYHISDLNKYMVFRVKENDTFSDIIKKTFAEYKEEDLNVSINENELLTFTSALSISDKELANMQAKRYTYGFINNSPYEVLISGSYGGIVSEYLTRFMDFSKTEINPVKYKNFAKFTEAIANNKVDIFYNYYNLDTKYQAIDSLMNVSFVVVAPEKNSLIINAITSLNGEEVYVSANSILDKYLSNMGNVEVKTYSNEKELKKAIRNEKILLIDREVYNYYKKSILSEYTVRYSNTLSDTYNFYVRENDIFSLLFNRYIETLDPNEVIVKGTYNHTYTMNSGTVLGQVAKYSVIVIIVFIIILYLAYRSTKKIKIAKKIKKEDKMKYIDQLTSLKNRNYLNENINSWNKNTIYPQATIIIDLNEVQKINDTLGYEQGDAQIKAAANVLIKTQLDNTDIMRTDGNEFLIYLVGYQEKQVVSYIRKLYKEFKNLPFEYGAAIGYSMILNDMKTIEDSINESVEDMRTKKEELEDGSDEKKES